MDLLTALSVIYIQAWFSMYSIAAMLDEFDKGFSLSKLAPRIKITRQYRMRDAYV